MAIMDRNTGVEHEGHPPARAADMTWLRESATWFGIAAAGMMVVFIGLAVDAYRHNHSAAEESLLSFGNPGHLIAAIGLVMSSAASLVGLSLTSMKNLASPEHAIRRLVPVTVAWVTVTAVAVASITYIGASGATLGHSHATTAGTSVVAADGHVHATTDSSVVASADDAGGVAAGLKAQGIDPSGGGGSIAAAGSSTPGSGAQATTSGGTTTTADAAGVAGALTQGSNGQPGHVHDHGKQPTFTQVDSMAESQLLPLFPADTISATDFPAWKDQVEAVRQVALKFPTTDDAAKAGYIRTTSDVPYMGEHWLNYDYVKSGIFDPNKPQGLLFSKIDNSGVEKLVGVWFLLIPGINGITRDVEPVGFAGNLDLWHAHTGLCLVAFSGASEGETRDSCKAKGGSFTADLRWMMHVWVAPLQENPDGVFAYLNADLWAKQQAVAKAAAAPTGSVNQ